MKASVTRRIYYSSEFTVAQTISSYAEPSFGSEVPKAFINFYGLHSANLNSLDTTTIYQNFGFGFCSPSIGTTGVHYTCLLYTSPSSRDRQKSRMPSST